MSRFNPEWLNRPRKRDNPEGRLVRQIITYIKARGHAAGKIKTMGVRRGNSFCFDPLVWRGCPDILAFIPHLIFIEAKSPAGTQSEEQKVFEQFCAQAKIPYILARSISDIEKII